MSPQRRNRQLEEVRQSAVHRAIDPVSLEDLRTKSNQVGALFLDGHRVEMALYHQSSVMDAAGNLTLRDGVSPVTHELVDEFRLAPPLTQLREFVKFLDWDRDHWLSVSEVAAALAALLPVDEEGVELFLRDHFDVGQDGFIEDDALRMQITPYCSERLREVLESAPVAEVPELRRGASREELLDWFNHWDSHGNGEINLNDFRFAVAWTLFQVLGEKEDAGTKETVASLFLAQADLTGEGHISSEAFVEIFGPALQANLPEPAPLLQNGGAPLEALEAEKDQEEGAAGTKPRARTGEDMLRQAMGEEDVKQLQKDDPKASPLSEWELAVSVVRLTLHAPVAGDVLMEDFTTQDTLGAVSSLASQTWPTWGPLRLYLAGRYLNDASQRLGAVKGMRSGVVLQVVPERGGGLGCAIM